ncbi:adrenocorticotropic hormone receptor-like [Montipora foliosa]|uniref:adrenocorticotropic hormone receptor-like n=1 Tax=Montipora foliosa TaxID=591990 RepID=UPI0035F1EDE4
MSAHVVGRLCREKFDLLIQCQITGEDKTNNLHKLLSSLMVHIDEAFPLIGWDRPYKGSRYVDECTSLSSSSRVMESFNYPLSPFNTNTSISNGDLAKLRSFAVANCIMNACTSFAAVFGNGVVLLAIWKSQSLHSPSNTLLFGLALTDFSVGTFIQPMQVAICLIGLVSNERSPGALQSSFDVLSVILSTASFTTATFISIDRYLVFHLHMRYNAIVTNKKVMVFMGFGLFLAGFLGFMWTLNLKAYYVTAVSSFLISFSIIVLMYFMIFRIIRRHQAQIRAQSEVATQQKTTSQRLFVRSTKSAVNTFYVCFFLFVCYFPYTCLGIFIQLTGYSITKYIALQLTGTVVFINSSLNPLVYLWRVVEIRKAVLSMLRCSNTENGLR